MASRKSFALVAGALIKRGPLARPLPAAAVASFTSLAGYQASDQRRSTTLISLGVFSAAAALCYTTGAYPSVALAEPSVVQARAVNRYARPAELKGLPKEVILYQYEVCPFCCKVKAFLDYHKIPYRTVEVSPLTKRELKWSEYKKVPVVVVDGDAVNDSSVIISRLAAELEAQQSKPAAEAQQPKRGWFGASTSQPPAATSPSSSAAGAEEEERWRRWVDDRFVRVITVNIYRNAKESFQTFDYITNNGNFNFLEREAARVIGATMMWGISGRLKKKYNIEGEAREEMYADANAWVDAVGERRFMGGDKPNLADLAVFGVIRSIACTDAFMDLMHKTRIGGWYERMMSAVGESSRLSAT
ncbi:hypothetical protein WJX72_001704 [[Myrmecia] bisecta]|uniref:Prostaglandin E synthase 2 n=1 Tax=[Myrmecia] bisecta TaxID=41462 RepID=A0AAW1Q6J4_9CHLO